MARRRVVTPSQLGDWNPTGTKEWFELEQVGRKAAFEKWAGWARRAYNVGILGFAWAVVAMLVPSGGLKDADRWRLAAFALASAWLAYQAVQVAITWWGDVKAKLTQS